MNLKYTDSRKAEEIPRSTFNSKYNCSPAKLERSLLEKAIKISVDKSPTHAEDVKKYRSNVSTRLKSTISSPISPSKGSGVKNNNYNSHVSDKRYYTNGNLSLSDKKKTLTLSKADQSGISLPPRREHSQLQTSLDALISPEKVGMPRQYNSNNSNSTLGEDIDLRHNYASENRGNKSDACKKLEEPAIKNNPIPEVSRRFKNPVEQKYFSTAAQNKTKNQDSGMNKIPILNKTDNKIKALNSVRLGVRQKNNLAVKNQKNDISTKTQTLRQTQDIKKRSPSIIKSKLEYREPSFDKKRSKSESNTIDKTKNMVASVPTDIMRVISAKQNSLPSFEPANIIMHQYGPIEAFASNMHIGTVRANNEDRVSIILKAKDKLTKSKTKSVNNCSIFSVFDGHGGNSCCNYLKDNLHSKLLSNLDVDGSLFFSIRQTYKQIDKQYIDKAMEIGKNFSGSCATTLIVINNRLVFANTGDSRAVISMINGTKVVQATADNKPDKISEFYRIIEKGGELYKMSSNKKTGQGNFHFVKTYNQLKKVDDMEKNTNNMLFGPWRVNPGGLAISRAFGDLGSKIPAMGGIVGLVTAEPDITEFNTVNVDFVFLACKINSRRNL